MKIWSHLHNDCAQVVCEQAAALPDYYPPVMRVVRAEGHPYIGEIREHDGVVTVGGEVELTLLYQTEDEKGLCSYRTTTAFSQSFSLPESCDGTPDAYVGRCEVTCRLSSARRVTFKADLPVYLAVGGEKELSGPAPQEDMLYLVKSVEGCCGLGCVSRRFHVSERGDCDRLPAAALETCAQAVVTEVSAAGGKTLVKGELTVRTLYVTREDEVGTVRYVFPLSQLLDLPFGEKIDTDVVFRVGGIEVEAGESLDGNKGRFTYEIDLSVIACATETRRYDLIGDAFSTTHVCDLAREQTDLAALVDRLRGSTDVDLPLPEDPEDGMVIDAKASIATLSGKVEGGKLQIEGECAVALLCMEDSGRIHSCELTVPLKTAVPCAKSGRVEIHGCVWSALLMPDGLRITLRYEAALRQDQSCERVTTAAPDPSRPLPPQKRYPVTVYFADQGELLWDIAKRYRIAPERICKCNSLEGDIITEKRRLLIL